MPRPRSLRSRTLSCSNSLATASWTYGDKTYILASPGDKAALREYF